MAKLKKCTERDISILLDSSSDDIEDYIPRKNEHNSSDSSDNMEIFTHNENLLQSNTKLQKKHTSLRLRLKRSTEQSQYKIDTSPEYERPQRLTRNGRHRLKNLQDENQTPCKRIIKVPTRYSDYECFSPNAKVSVLRRDQIKYNEEDLSPESITIDKKKKEIKKQVSTKSDDSDSDCICVKFISQSKKSNTISKNNKRNHTFSTEDIDATLPKVIKTRTSKRISAKKEFKGNNIDKIPFNEKAIPNSQTNTMQYVPLGSTPKKRSRINRSNRINILSTPKYESTINENKNNEIDEVSLICEVAEDLLIDKSMKKIKQTTKDEKNVIESVIHNTLSTPKSCASLKYSALTPSVKMRTGILAKPVTPLQEARSRLHVSAVPKSLPCREEEFNNIYTFLESKLMDNSGGCIYISGVPGTGKTATVNEVVKCLKRSVTKKTLKYFDFIEINGMKLSEPRQAYVQILKQLSGQILTWEQAYNALEKKFKSTIKRPMTLLLVDELDLLCTKRQDVVYNLLDWPAKISSQLVVITIANTMDLPERILMGRVTSRLGLTRVTFQPYNHKQLQEIVITRLKDINVFKSEAIQLIARKVSAVSGDARRALDICRRAAEITEIHDGDIVSMQDVNQALSEMIATPKVQAIRYCSAMEQIFLQAVLTEVTRTGVEEVCFTNVYKQLESLCSFDGIQRPNITEALAICARLGVNRLLICEHSKNDIQQRILLNVSTDDIHYALQPVNLD